MKTYQNADSIELVFSGVNYFEVLEKMIDDSRESVHLQTYILETDETGLPILESLKRAAKRKVAVYILVDAYGSHPFSKEVSNDLISSGIHFRLFSPLFSSESVYFGRRLHHKIIVVDKKIALTGGINIADKYRGTAEQAWLDYAVLSKGEVCEYLHWLCDAFYKKRRSPSLTNWEKNSVQKNEHNSQHLIRYRRNDWIKRKNEIHKSYMEAILSAEHCITIVASYFLPGATFRKMLKAAAARGVEIKIILAGQSDINSLRLAESYLYDFYLKNNIRIYEWSNSVMHGKAMVADHQWATIGSYNLNFLSHYISIELNTDIRDREFVNKFTDHLNEVMTSNCNAIEYKQEEIKPSQKFKMWLAYTFYRLLMSFMMLGRKYRLRPWRNRKDKKHN